MPAALVRACGLSRWRGLLWLCNGRRCGFLPKSACWPARPAGMLGLVMGWFAHSTAQGVCATMIPWRWRECCFLPACKRRLPVAKNGLQGVARQAVWPAGFAKRFGDVLRHRGDCDGGLFCSSVRAPFIRLLVRCSKASKKTRPAPPRWATTPTASSSTGLCDFGGHCQGWLVQLQNPGAGLCHVL